MLHANPLEYSLLYSLSKNITVMMAHGILKCWISVSIYTDHSLNCPATEQVGR